ncbi:MAG: DUF4998 domain-containing protein [Dysgonomonas sp.]
MKYKLSTILLLFVGFILKSCTGMDEVYKEFLKPEIIYVGKADSLKVFPGNGRLIINFELTDPSITHATFYWNNKSDSAKMNISMEKTKEIIDVEIENLSEGTYSFDAFTYNEKGNSSIKATVVGRVYGEKFADALLDTPVKGAYVNDKDHTKVDVDWGNPDATALGMEIIYTNSSDEEVFLYAPITPNMPSTVLSNHKENTNFRYRTLFLPEENAIDTFYTSYKSARVKGVATEYNRSLWTATGDYDKGNPRPPQNMLDGNIGSVWHMDKTPGKYPHIATIDMKQMNVLSGFYFYQRRPLDGAVNLIEIKISTDGETWKTLGEFNLASKEDKLYVELTNDVECRYFQIIVKSDHKGGSATAVGELGAYRR